MRPSYCKSLAKSKAPWMSSSNSLPLAPPKSFGPACETSTETLRDLQPDRVTKLMMQWISVQRSSFSQLLRPRAQGSRRSGRSGLRKRLGRPRLRPWLVEASLHLLLDLPLGFQQAFHESSAHGSSLRRRRLLIRIYMICDIYVYRVALRPMPNSIMSL